MALTDIYQTLLHDYLFNKEFKYKNLGCFLTKLPKYITTFCLPKLEVIVKRQHCNSHEMPLPSVTEVIRETRYITQVGT